MLPSNNRSKTNNQTTEKEIITPIDPLEKEVHKVYRRYSRNHLEMAHYAKEGALTYTKLADGTIRFERWKYEHGRFIGVALNAEEQKKAQDFLGKYVLSSPSSTAVATV